MKRHHYSYLKGGKMVRIRTFGSLNEGGSKTAGDITNLTANEVLVIETISVSIRIPYATPLPEVSRLTIATGYPNANPPLIDLPVTRMAIDPAGNLVNYIALANVRAYATDGFVKYSIDFSVPSMGDFDVSLFGYILPADSPSLSS
jgi:hypothetical protein